MVIILEKLFVLQLELCDKDFRFRKIYQQLKVVDKVTEIKNVFPLERNFYKLIIDKSKIALRVSDETVTVGCFLQNQFFSPQI